MLWCCAARRSRGCLAPRSRAQLRDPGRRIAGNVLRPPTAGASSPLPSPPRWPFLCWLVAHMSVSSVSTHRRTAPLHTPLRLWLKNTGLDSASGQSCGEALLVTPPVSPNQPAALGVGCSPASQADGQAWTCAQPFRGGCSASASCYHVPTVSCTHPTAEMPSLLSAMPNGRKKQSPG